MSANLTPPAVKTKNDSVTPPGAKAEKAPKAVKAPKVVDPNAPKKTRTVVSFPKNAILHVTAPAEGESRKFRGKRADYYAILQDHDGKTVEAFLAKLKAKNDEKGGGPGAWLRWFYENKLVTVEKVEG